MVSLLAHPPDFAPLSLWRNFKLVLGFCGNGSAPTMAGSGQVGTCEGEIEEARGTKRNRERKEVTECDDEQSVCVRASFVCAPL